MTPEQFRQRGLIRFTHNSLDTFKVDVEQMQKVPFGRIIRPGKHGLCFIMYPKPVRIPVIPIKEKNKDPDPAADSGREAPEIKK